MRRIGFVLASVLVVTLAMPAPTAADRPREPVFDIRDLGNLGDAQSGPSSANAVNERGSVAGTTRRSDGLERAFRWDPSTGVIDDLGTFGGFTSQAFGINDRGVVVGAADTSSGATHAFRWDPRTNHMVDLGTLGGSTSRAFAINNHGVIVGVSSTAEGVDHAFRWNPRTGAMSDLGTLGGDSSAANAINDRGVIVGSAATAEGLSHAFRWDPRAGRMSDLGVLPGTIVSFAHDINDHGVIVGTSADAGDDTSRAFRWSPRGGASGPHPHQGTMLPIDGIGSGSTEATAVNDRGFVVGARLATGEEFRRAFIWSPKTGTAVDLIGLDGDEAFALDVNNHLTVAGTARAANGQFAAVLWVPR